MKLNRLPIFILLLCLSANIYAQDVNSEKESDIIVNSEIVAENDTVLNTNEQLQSLLKPNSFKIQIQNRKPLFPVKDFHFKVCGEAF